MLPIDGDRAPLFDVLTLPGPKSGRLWPALGDVVKGYPLDGTLRRRPGVRVPCVYMLWERECDEMGEATPEPQRGLFWPVEKVADVGVLRSLGDPPRYPMGGSR